MKKGCLLVITMFLTYLVHSQDKAGLSIPQLLDKADACMERTGQVKPNLDSAFLLISEVRKANAAHNDPRIEGRCLLLFAKATRIKGDTPRAKAAAFEALTLLGKERTVELAEAEFEAARYYDYTIPVQNDRRIALYRDAASIFGKAGRRLQQARALELLGDCLQYYDISVTEALPPLLEAFRIYTALRETDLRNISALLASTYSRIGDHRSALLYGLKALKEEEAWRTPSISLCTSYNRVGLVYYNMGDYAHADTALTRAVAVARRFHDTDAIKETLLNHILVKIKLAQTDSALLIADDLARNYPFVAPFDRIQLQQRFLRVYIANGRFQRAKPLARRFMLISDSLKAADFIREYIDPVLVEYALAIKDYPLARKYALRYRGFCIDNHHSTALYKTYYQLYLTDSAEGRFRSAMANYQQYVQLRDSLQNKTDSNQVLALQQKVDTSPPSVRPVTSHPKEMGREIVLITGALLVVILGFLYYIRYRSMRRSRQLQAEKEWLVKELHHRVKNNLQIVMSLLNTQSHYLDNEKAQAAISQSRNRMYALSLIHQRLYQPDNLEQIDMKRYVPDLVQYLRDSFPNQRRIVFHLDIDPAPLDVAIAVPIGLILNEAISNSLQWAFPGDRSGSVRILLNYQQGLFLEIADDGIGLPSGHESQRQQSMGFQLIETLVQQLEGAVSVTSANGTRISIRLPHTEPA
jgi:two-component sensor histidine kinase